MYKSTGLERVILWRKEKECTAQCQMIHECNSTCYIRVIGEVEDYYGVHEIIAFDVRPVSSGNEVTHHFLEVAYSFEKRILGIRVRWTWESLWTGFHVLTLPGLGSPCRQGFMS